MAAGDESFRYFVLGLLDREPMSGYDIKGLLERLNGLIGSSSYGNIYPTLHALLEEGWVSVDVVTHPDRPPKKLYTLEQEGRDELLEWLEGPIPENLSKKAFVMRLILAQDFAGSGLAAHLRQRRAHVVAHLDALRELGGEPEPQDAEWPLALDYGLAVADAELAWLDHALDAASAESFPGERVEQRV